MMSSQQVYFVAVAALVYYILSYARTQRRRKGAKPPPGPKGWPLVGNAPELASSDGNLIPIFGRWADTYGHIVQFSILGEKQVVLSTNKATVDLFVLRGDIYSGRGAPSSLERITDNLNPALMPKNEAWRRERKLIHQGVSIVTNAKYQGYMLNEAALTLKELLSDPERFEDHFVRYAYGMVLRSVFGIRATSAGDKFITAQEKFHDDVLKCFRPDEYPSNVFPFLRHLPTWLMPSLGRLEKIRQESTRSRRELRRLVEMQIREGAAADSLYRHYLENRDQYAASEEEASRTFEALLGAGTRSPFNGLLSFLYLMMEYPEWQQKLHAQVDHVVGPDRLPNFDDIPKLPVVRAIVKESIRYRSIVAELGIPHRLDQDDVYDGFFFEKGTVFHANYAKILMDKETYPDQQVFNPARWLEPSYPTYKEPLTVHPNCQNFTPFGYGRRACPGYDFAERSLVVMVAQIGWALNISKPIDPATKKPVVIDMKYEPTPNPRPLPFPCDIRPRSTARMAIVEATRTTE